MNSDNSFLKNEINAMREESAPPEAKAELILKLSRGNEPKPMSLIKKLSIPTAITAVAIVGASLVLRPEAVASPSSVAKAIREAMNYTIKSFSVEGGKRQLESESTMKNGKKNIRYFDQNGKEIDSRTIKEIEQLREPGNRMGIQFNLDGGVGEIPKEKLDALRKDLSVFMGKSGTTKFIRMSGGSMSHDDVLKNMSKDGKIVVSSFGTGTPGGKITRKIIVNGKEVSELPKDLQDKIKISTSKDGVPHVKVNGADSNVKTKTITNQNIIMLNGGKGSKEATILQSGRTSAEYLIKLLADESKWEITRGVSINGQKLDKFVMKGPMSPIELYVDSSTSLPKILRFKSFLDESKVIEDVYEYGDRP